MTESIQIRSLDRIDDIDASTWDELNALAGGSVLSSHRFLSAFEKSNSVCPAKGWQAHHVVMQDDQGQVLALVPMYAKGHSYGEFVFDWAWADAYERAGLNYYPKWLCATPFTPVTGARLLCAPAHRSLAAQALIKTVKATKLSSLHVLYTNTLEQDALIDAGCLARHHTQFHWLNQGWPSFDAFLAQLTQPKRKKIRAERRKVAQAGVRCITKNADEITASDWDFFYRCYANTYAERGNPPYLRREFFDLIDPACCLLTMGLIDEQPVACALLWIDGVTDPDSGQASKRIYGRYWGQIKHIDCLHFELAYYQPIEWAIEHQIDVFEGGAQGEHKMARGFTPVQTRSAHWLAHPGFAQAVADYLQREQTAVEGYEQSLSSPFKA